MLLTIKEEFALITGKIIAFLCKLLSLGASAAPGYYALKISPTLLKKLTKQLSFSIVISGTNGKTTTSRLIATILKEVNINFYYNAVGSNLLRGITSILIQKADLKGRLKPIIGLWEVDEGVIPAAVKILKPKYIVILNLFRDQLDRYAEIELLRKKWESALKNSVVNFKIIFNSDDPSLAYIASKLKKLKNKQIISFGISDLNKSKRISSEIALDSFFCPHCRNELKYKGFFYSHLGIYKCKKCSFSQPPPKFQAKKIRFISANKTSLYIKWKSKKSWFTIPFGGIYSVYNFLAAFSLATLLNISSSRIKKSLINFRPPFGRQEKIKYKGKNIEIILVKNPAGFNQALNFLIKHYQKKEVTLLIALNDLIADGKDISWIWDVDFHLLKELPIKKFLLSGLRAEELVLRLKYENIKKPYQIIKNPTKAIKFFLMSKEKNLVILPTYTALLKIRKKLFFMGISTDIRQE